MELNIESRHLEDLVVLVPDIFRNGRGFFTETFRADKFESARITHRTIARDQSSC